MNPHVDSSVLAQFTEIADDAALSNNDHFLSGSTTHPLAYFSSETDAQRVSSEGSDVLQGEYQHVSSALPYLICMGLKASSFLVGPLFNRSSGFGSAAWTNYPSDHADTGES